MAIRRVVEGELREEVKGITLRVSRLEVDVADVRELSARVDGQMTLLVSMHNRMAEAEAARERNELEVQRVERLTEIRERRDRGKGRRELALKAAGVLTGLMAIVSAMIGHGC